MSIYQLKPKFQALLRPLVVRLAAAGVTANQVTLAAVLLSLFGGILLFLMPGAPGPLLFVPVILFVRMALNAIDGMLAREHGQQSALGAILNELGDVISDTALYLPFALIPGIGPAWIVAIVILAILTEMTGIIGIQIGASRRYDGPLGKSDRAALFGALALYFGFALPAHALFGVLFAVVCLALISTVVNRARKALQEVA